MAGPLPHCAAFSSHSTASNWRSSSNNSCPACPIDNPQVTGNNGNYVTDGPFLFREDGKIKMIWSSFANGRYVVLEAQADSLLGPWTHFESRFDFDGGHAILFADESGRRHISLHAPNRANEERATFFAY